MKSPAEIYDDYRRFCASLGVPAPPRDKWNNDADYLVNSQGNTDKGLTYNYKDKK